MCLVVYSSIYRADCISGSPHPNLPTPRDFQWISRSFFCLMSSLTWNILCIQIYRYQRTYTYYIICFINTFSDHWTLKLANNYWRILMLVNEYFIWLLMSVSVKFICEFKSTSVIISFGNSIFREYLHSYIYV